MANLSTNTISGLASALSSKSGAKEIESLLAAQTPASRGADPTGNLDATGVLSAILAESDHVYIPSGHTYKLGSTLTVDTGQSIRGDGATSILTYTGSGTAILYDAETAIEGITLIGDTSGAVSGSVGVGPNSTSPSDYDRSCTLRNLRISYFGDGIKASFNGVLSIYDPYIEFCTNGLRITGTEANGLNVVGGEIRECDIGIFDDATTGSAHSFLGMVIEGNNSYGYRKTANGSTSVAFRSCYFEENDVVGGAGIDLSLASFSNLLLVENCTFVGATHTAINVQSCVSGIIQNNHFANNTASIILGADARYITVGKNNYGSGADVFDPTTDDTGFLNNTAPGAWPGTYGVRGNGTTDDTTNLATWLAANPKEAYLPPGTYMVSASLALATGQRLRGAGKGLSILKAVAATTVPLVTLATDSILSDVSVLGVSVAASSGVKPQSGASRWLMERVEVSLFANNVVVDSVLIHGTIRSCRIFSGTTTGITVSAGVAGLAIVDCNVLDTPRNIYVTGAAVGLKIRDNRIRGASANGLEATAATLGMVIDGNIFDNNTTTDILLSTASQSATRIVSNRFVTTPTSVSVALADQTIIEGNYFQPAGGTPKSISITNSGAVGTVIGQNSYAAGTFDYGVDNSGTGTFYLGRIFANAAPGSGTWVAGDVVWDISPTSGQPAFFVCTVGGTPGTWFSGTNLS
jgi:hypothetical protein